MAFCDVGGRSIESTLSSFASVLRTHRPEHRGVLSGEYPKAKRG